MSTPLVHTHKVAPTININRSFAIFSLLVGAVSGLYRLVLNGLVFILTGYTISGVNKDY